MHNTTPFTSDLTAVANQQAAVPTGVGDYYRALFQQLRTSFGGLQDTGRALGITSSVGGEGVTTVCQNLVVSAAQQLLLPVLLIDANLRGTQKPASGEPTRGLYDALVGGAEPADCIRPAATRNVYVLSAGSRAARSGVPYPKDAFVELVDGLKREFRFIVVDLPVANELTDCFSICGLLDGLLLVVEAERVRSPVVTHARDHLFQAGARMMGIVFNKRRNHVPDWLYRRL
jgi:Mrp family chromosome partitioning ATPase